MKFHLIFSVPNNPFFSVVKKLNKGINESIANSILVKVNQIGTLTETIDAVNLAQDNSYTSIMSHRSGETEDTTIADLAVALQTGGRHPGVVPLRPRRASALHGDRGQRETHLQERPRRT